TILLAASRPDLADLFRALAAAVAEVTFDVAQKPRVMAGLKLNERRYEKGQTWLSRTHSACRRFSCESQRKLMLVDKSDARRSFRRFPAGTIVGRGTTPLLT